MQTAVGSHKGALIRVGLPSVLLTACAVQGHSTVQAVQELLKQSVQCKWYFAVLPKRLVQLHHPYVCRMDHDRSSKQPLVLDRSWRLCVGGSG